MAESKSKGTSKRVSISKRKLAQTAEDLEVAAVVAGIQGAAQVVEGAEEIVSQRMAKLSETVAVAGVVDMAEGIQMLAASEDVSVMSALVGLMSFEDIEHGLELARLSGEFSAVSQ